MPRFLRGLGGKGVILDPLAKRLLRRLLLKRKVPTTTKTLLLPSCVQTSHTKLLKLGQELRPQLWNARAKTHLLQTQRLCSPKTRSLPEGKNKQKTS